MKRRYFAALFALMLLVGCFAVSAAATQAQLSYVTDESGMFSDSERTTLENRAAAISEKYNFGVYIIVLPDYTQYTYSSSVETCAKELYDEYDLGWGSDNAGVLLLLSMAERDFNVNYNSSRSNQIFTEYGRDMLENRVIPFFRENDFYRGFLEYLDVCEEYLLAAQNGNPVDAEASPALALIPGGIAALLVGLLTSAPMRSAKQQRAADQYVAQGGLNLRRRSDMFLHRTVTRTPRNTNSGSSGGSHSHSYSSGSHSGRSGKF